ncbi:NADH-quinone oxidoreductase subunit L [Mucilaginibacter sp. RB4R14]|uniref:NADH-quinone oxidoreductase subunit 5 family protein n=1 Tax=Mucilaginibacter aurantiaciroseus TaxID=2949308 RepID=UPI0020906A24|nr:NADH-quinone oxidoreductase subunit L [Mucilaginibacter aurantiaciroseus]MCO5936203.1 NADH-quinone oxidoreductase subunit L [Mucilaginibacter aurantiaciroseus]
MNPTLPQTDAQTVTLAIIAVVLPFAAFLVNFLLLGKSKVSGWVSTLAILVSTVLAANVFFKIWGSHTIHAQQVWFTIGATKVQAGVLLNNLSVLLLLLVPVIALPVHIYSTAYMEDDDGYSRYFRYLSLFCFSMLALVVVDNLILLYAFWEMVGFSSYLLIGFWFTRESAIIANKKAFIMNRIGDIGLLSAIIILFTQFHTFDLEQLFAEKGLIENAIIANGEWTSTLGSIPATWQYVAFGGIFLAVAAKSAQFPLHTWLPDAMEGPTSVSALIHAATMVAAGVFLLGRFYPMFTGTELTILAVIGCFTAFMAATIALTQNDLKRILAYSTISQLGFMVMAMGVGAYASSLFHLATHAFFKCLLFLVAGIVIHQMKQIKDDNNLDTDPQNILHMGGLRKKLPLTFIAALIGGIALTGLPLTSGYLSKDGILIQAFDWSDDKGGLLKLIPYFALLTSWLTAFYVARLITKVFFGEFRLQKMNPHIRIHMGDGGWQYKLPLVFLAICCLFPVFSYSPVFYEDAWLYKGFLLTNIFVRQNLFHVIIPLIVVILSVVVMYGAYVIYVKRNTWSFPQKGLLYRISFNEWYIDRFYNRVIIRFVMWLSNAFYWFEKKVVDGFVNSLEKVGLAIAGIAAWFDKNIVDGFLHLVADVVHGIGSFARRFQGGKIQYYLYSMLLVLITVFILKLIWT